MGRAMLFDIDNYAAVLKVINNPKVQAIIEETLTFAQKNDLAEAKQSMERSMKGKITEAKDRWYSIERNPDGTRVDDDRKELCEPLQKKYGKKGEASTWYCAQDMKGKDAKECLQYRMEYCLKCSIYRGKK